MTRQLEQETTRVDQSGFSIIELIIAMVVILIGFISIVGISVYVSRANYTSNTLNVLASTAQDQVDRLRTSIWNATTEDPSLAVGGSVEIASTTPSSPTTPMSVSPMSASSPSSPSSPSQTPEEIYEYTIDPDNPHSATVVNTPAGDLIVSWQVRQGATADLRYVTIRVAQANPSGGLERGYTVSTIIVRN
jgi:prepilin-type N-terminal cleavage/methylation domain-containing protein